MKVQTDETALGIDLKFFCAYRSRNFKLRLALCANIVVN